MTHWKLFKSKACNVRLKGADKAAVLAEVVDQLIEGECLAASLREAAIEALREREAAGSTGVGMTVAIPHVKLKGIDRVACSVSVHPTGVEWQAIDGEPVQIVFTVLRPEKGGAHHDPDKHLDLMRWIARLARDADFRRFALHVKTKAALVDLLKEKSAV